MTIDPRAFSKQVITPEPPLPYVSRRSLMKIKDSSPKPTDCHYCNSPVFLVNNLEIYGKSYGEWPYVYKCSGCDSYVGLHNHTDLPLGTLANKPTREARKKYKKAFFELSELMGWSRRQAYQWLANRMGIPSQECHWGMFSVDQAEIAGAICEEMLTHPELMQN